MMATDLRVCMSRVVKAWEESKESKAQPPPRSEGEQGKTGGEQGEDWPNKRRNQILAGSTIVGSLNRAGKMHPI